MNDTVEVEVDCKAGELNKNELGHDSDVISVCVADVDLASAFPSFSFSFSNSNNSLQNPD